MSSNRGADEPSLSAPDAPASTGAHARPVRIEPDLDAWKQSLREEDRRLDALRIPAALVTIGLVRAADAARALTVLDTGLRPTDRVGVLCDDELSVLLSPVVDIHDAQGRAQQLSEVLQGAGVDVHVGWAMRLPGHGLFHALARADAAMLTAKGHGHLSVDLGARERRSREP